MHSWMRFCLPACRHAAYLPAFLPYETCISNVVRTLVRIWQCVCSNINKHLSRPELLWAVGTCAFKLSATNKFRGHMALAWKMGSLQPTSSVSRVFWEEQSTSMPRRHRRVLVFVGWIAALHLAGIVLLTLCLDFRIPPCQTAPGPQLGRIVLRIMGPVCFPSIITEGLHTVLV